MTIGWSRSGCGATSSSLTSCGTPSSAAPVNISDPTAAWSRWSSGTIFAFGLPCTSTKLMAAYFTPLAASVSATSRAVEATVALRPFRVVVICFVILPMRESLWS